MKVAVIGAGHVGLVTGAGLASLGHDVVATDSDQEKVGRLRMGEPVFYEPGLPELLAEGTAAGRLRFTSVASEAVAVAEVVFICVGTPPDASGEANLVAVEQSAIQVARHATNGAVVVEKSTVPAGTAERVGKTLARERPEAAFEVVSNPEFLREGRAVRDFLQPHRILVGSDSHRGFEIMRRLYEPLTRRGHPLIETDIRTAELAKHACNAFLALKISFANALARLCERAQGDVTKVADIMGSDPRIGRSFLDAGLGYGGYCFPKDLASFGRLADNLGYDFNLLDEIAQINEEAVDSAVAKVREAVWNISEKRVALLGLAFKPGTDDVRFSPALNLARRLISGGAQVVGYDPEASGNAKADLPELEIALDPYETASGAHCLVLCTEWDEFRSMDVAKLKTSMAYPMVVDGRNFWDPQAFLGAGFTYYSMGRPPMFPQVTD